MDANSKKKVPGNTITRDANSNRGEGKLSGGEQSFSFDTGTVRLSVCYWNTHEEITDFLQQYQEIVINN